MPADPKAAQGLVSQLVWELTYVRGADAAGSRTPLGQRPRRHDPPHARPSHFGGRTPDNTRPGRRWATKAHRPDAHAPRAATIRIPFSDRSGAIASRRVSWPARRSTALTARWPPLPPGHIPTSAPLITPPFTAACLTAPDPKPHGRPGNSLIGRTLETGPQSHRRTPTAACRVVASDDVRRTEYRSS